METQAQILIGKVSSSSSNSSVKKVCVGKLYGIGACFPKVAGMTDAEHDQISRAARWMFDEPIRPRFVDLDSGYRVSLF